MKIILFIVTTSIFIILFNNCSEENTPNTVNQNSGKIVLFSNPSGANIFLLGTNTGKVTPDSLLNLESGNYELTLKLAGFRDTTFIVQVFNNLTSTKNITLDSIAIGVIFLSSDPEGALISINGTLTDNNTPDTISNLIVGNYQINLELANYLDSAFSVQVFKNQITNKYVELLIPSSDISYNNHIQPIFDKRCISCHNPNTMSGNLDLTSWSTTVSNPSIIFPGDPDNSILVRSIEFQLGYSPMPPDSQLTSNRILSIRKWIEEGALNN